MADAAEKPVGRPMKFPYTFTSKLMQFPLKYYVGNQWVYKYYVVAVVLCLPLFNSIRKLTNSPENVAKWAKIRREEREGHH